MTLALLLTAFLPADARTTDEATLSAAAPREPCTWVCVLNHCVCV